MKISTRLLYRLVCRLKPLLIILGWATSYAAATLGAMFQGLLLPRVQGGLIQETISRTFDPVIFYLGWLAISLVAASVIGDPGRALASFFPSYGLAGAVIYLVLTLPGLIGAFPFAEVLARSSVIFTFTALFPIPLIVGFLGTILGIGIGERFFQ